MHARTTSNELAEVERLSTQAPSLQEGGPSLQEGESAAEVEALKTLKLEELEDHGLIGSGSSGLVRKVAHLPTGRTLVLKVRWQACFLTSSAPDYALLSHS